MRIGTVKQIWRFAVKSMAGEQLDRCTVGTRGIPGDRGWAIRDEHQGKLVTGSRHPLLMQCAARYREQPANGFIPHVDMQLPDGSRIGSDRADVNAHLSELLGKSVSLSQLPPFAEENGNSSMFPQGTYFDVAPVHVLTTASLEAMRRLQPAADWDVRRFRPNFFVETEPGIEGLIEFDWNGQTLRLGEIELRCEIACERCAMANHAQAALPKDDSVLRTIAKEANTNLGTYANVTKPGEVRLGDIVELI
jgi:MOSC domain-containing protein